MQQSAALIRRVRTIIYEHVVNTGRAPSIEDVVAVEGGDMAEIANAFRELAQAHVVVLKPGTTELWSAPPFSAVPTGFRAQNSRGSWYAPCAWDMFGVPAALKSDAALDARCAWSGDPLPAAIRNGDASGAGIIHLVVPARHFWDDIFYT